MTINEAHHILSTILYSNNIDTIPVDLADYVLVYENIMISLENGNKELYEEILKVSFRLNRIALPPFRLLIVHKSQLLLLERKESKTLLKESEFISIIQLLMFHLIKNNINQSENENFDYTKAISTIINADKSYIKSLRSTMSKLVQIYDYQLLIALSYDRLLLSQFSTTKCFDGRYAQGIMANGKYYSLTHNAYTPMSKLEINPGSIIQLKFTIQPDTVVHGELYELKNEFDYLFLFIHTFIVYEFKNQNRNTKQVKYIDLEINDYVQKRTDSTFQLKNLVKLSPILYELLTGRKLDINNDPPSSTSTAAQTTTFKN
ncbi:unnamed protein product [Rotaria sordida]|uniref:Uncharacterized protein n=1 Tax=Rotaria sordida TaxID=392033 RepID=A0A818US20_9BILA|nr:unnamed protein product [Rotaria sordida]